MVEKTDIFEAASNLIERFGETAAEEAARRARELRDEGKPEAYLFWLEVLGQVRALEAQHPADKQN